MTSRGRIIRTANADGIETYTYRGDEEEPYLEQSCDTVGNMQSQTVSEYNPKTGETTRTSIDFRGRADWHMDHGEGCTRFHTAHGKQCA